MRSYRLPDKDPNETNQEWCKRAAKSIPAECLVAQLMDYLNRSPKPRNLFKAEYEWCDIVRQEMTAETFMWLLIKFLMRPTKKRPSQWLQWSHAWPFVSDFTGHGSGVSGAIVERFSPNHPTADHTVDGGSSDVLAIRD